MSEMLQHGIVLLAVLGAAVWLARRIWLTLGSRRGGGCGGCAGKCGAKFSEELKRRM